MKKIGCVFLKMGIKKEAPSLFCFGSHQALPTAQCSDGALIRFDLAHIIEVECVIGLDYQLVLPVLLDVEGVPLVVVGELPVLWMLRNVVFVTEKRSHASKLQNTLGSVHDGDLILRHQFFATMSSDEFKNGQKNNPPRLKGGKCYFKCSYLTIIFSLGLQIGFIHNTTVSGSTSYSQASILASTIIPISQA